MVTENQNQDAGAAGETQTATPTTPVEPQPPKVEFKDGAAFMEVGGKMVKLVKESDLIAAKQSLERQLETQQSTHSQAIDAVNIELSSERQKVADLNAKLKSAQESAPGQGAVSDDEIARIKQERDAAVKSVEALTTQAGKALELKKSLLISQYPGVTAEQLAEKTMEQLDSLEEALKTVSSARGGGIGAYATGAGLGQAQPMSDYDRRKAALDGAKVGTRTAATE